jgi:hypothetical protein
MPNDEIKIQVDISPTEQDLTPDATPGADGSFRIVMGHGAAQSMDLCEENRLNNRR